MLRDEWLPQAQLFRDLQGVGRPATEPLDYSSPDGVLYDLKNSIKFFLFQIKSFHVEQKRREDLL